jgi:hypothetical protein
VDCEARAEVDKLLDVTRRFLAGEIDAATFDARYAQGFADANGDWGDEVFGELESLAVTVNMYVEDPARRTQPDDIDEDELRATAARVRESVAALIGPGD